MLLDLDGTIIGGITSACCEYELIKELYRDDPRQQTARLGALREATVARMRRGIVRPGFQDFLRRATRLGVAFFVYTASADDWAGFVVPCVEAAMKFKFGRPLFCRSDCYGTYDTSFTKSIPRVLARVCLGLQRRSSRPRTRPPNSAPPNSAHMVVAASCKLDPSRVLENAVLVDNTPGALGTTGGRQLLCETYPYNYLHDVLEGVDVDTLHDKLPRVIEVLRSFQLFPSRDDADSFEAFAALYYSRLASAVARARPENEVSLAKDRFWSQLAEALEALPIHSPLGQAALPAVVNHFATRRVDVTAALRARSRQDAGMVRAGGAPNTAVQGGGPTAVQGGGPTAHQGGGPAHARKRIRQAAPGPALATTSPAPATTTSPAPATTTSPAHPASRIGELGPPRATAHLASRIGVLGPPRATAHPASRIGVLGPPRATAHPAFGSGTESPRALNAPTLSTSSVRSSPTLLGRAVTAGSPPPAAASAAGSPRSATGGAWTS
jgi:hypothetical protein